ncbi:MAG TPA: hypothetical protein VEH58_04705 [Dehalococcoidales bacterium]|nr:hypothetical protein [Dehalococcoidales bacterium]
MAAVIAFIIIGTVVASSCSKGKSQTINPVEVVSVVGPLSPINPGGPVLRITLKNVSNTSIESLSSALSINSTQNKPFNFNFAVSTSNPLLPGNEVSSPQLTLIGGGFDSDTFYPLEIVGLFQKGGNFDYTVQVTITPPPTTAVTSTVTSNPVQTTTTGTKVNGLELTLTLNKPNYSPGEQITISIDEKNILPANNKLMVANKWRIKGLNLGPCGVINYPFGIVVLLGNYDVTSLTSISPLQLYDPNAVYNCPLIISGITAYEFQPDSDTAAIYTGADSNPLTLDMNTKVSTSGSWSGSPKTIFNNFSPGIYTAIAGDEWGNIVSIHFTVN